MSLSEEKSAEEKAAEHRRKKILSRNGQDAESGIAPEGRRDGVGDTRAVPGTSS